METIHTRTDDQALWEMFLSGDDRAYGEIYDRYARYMFMQGLQFTDDRDMVRDCIHDIFVKIYSGRSGLRPVSNLRVYLFIALRNSIATASKSKRLLFDANLDSAGSEAGDGTVEEMLITLEGEKEVKDLIGRILSELTPRQREAVHYRYVLGMAIGEICQIMDMNYQSVQNLLQRSVKKVRILYKKFNIG